MYNLPAKAPRKQKHKMSETELADWTISAEKLRDEWLRKYARDNSIDLEEYRQSINNV